MKKGNLLYAATKINGELVPVLWFAKLGNDEYIVILDSIFRKDPIKRRFSFVNEKQFEKATKGYMLQSEN